MSLLGINNKNYTRTVSAQGRRNPLRRRVKGTGCKMCDSGTDLAVPPSDLVVSQLPVCVGDQSVHPRQQVADVLAARLLPFHPDDLVPPNIPALFQPPAGQLTVLHPPGTVEFPDLVQNPVPNFAPKKVVDDAHAVRVHAGDDVVQHQPVAAAVPPVFGSGVDTPGLGTGQDPGPISDSRTVSNPTVISGSHTNCNSISCPSLDPVYSPDWNPEITFSTTLNRNSTTKLNFDNNPNLGLKLISQKSLSRSGVGLAESPGRPLLRTAVVGTIAPTFMGVIIFIFRDDFGHRTHVCMCSHQDFYLFYIQPAVL